MRRSLDINDITSIAAAAPLARPVFGLADAKSIVADASRAPSIHNTQPWSWQFSPRGLELRADRSRQLRVADPDGHSLMVSCGAAVELTDLAVRAAGWSCVTRLLPDRFDTDLLATYTQFVPVPVKGIDIERLAASARRVSDRRPFRPETVTENDIEALRGAADGHGVHVHFSQQRQERTNLAVAVSSADRVERADRDYLAEAAYWLREGTGSVDGVPLTAVPRVTAGHPRHTEIPVRDFEIGTSGREQIPLDVDEQPSIAVILGNSDSPLIQLRSGIAMMRLMIAAELLGVSSCPLSQAVDLGAFRSRLQTLMGWQAYPEMMLRLGYPPSPAEAESRSARRPVSQVLMTGT